MMLRSEEQKVESVELSVGGVARSARRILAPHLPGVVLAVLAAGCAVDPGAVGLDGDCGPAAISCVGICVNPLSDLGHCGASGDCLGVNAGKSCSANESCITGACVAEANPDPVPVSVPQTDWTLHDFHSEEVSPDKEESPALNAFDGDASTHWHTQWGDTPHPHWIAIDLHSTHVLSQFSYLPRQDGSQNAMVKDYRFFVSSDGVNWGNPVSTGAFPNNAGEQVVEFASTRGRYIKLETLSEQIAGQDRTAVAELSLLGILVDASGREPPPPALPDASLQADRTSVEEGESVTLSWTSNRASSCEGSGFATEGEISGSVRVFPATGARSYVLVCTGLDGESLPATVTVTLRSPDTPTGGGSSCGSDSTMVLCQDFDDVPLTDTDFFTDSSGQPIASAVRGLTTDMAREMFLMGGRWTPDQSIVEPHESGGMNYQYYVVDSPDGNQTRGKVLRTITDEGSYRVSDGVNGYLAANQLRFAGAHPQSGSWNEMYMSMEMYTPYINPLTNQPTQTATSRKSPLGLYGGNLSFEGIRAPGDTTYCDGRTGTALTDCLARVAGDGWSARMAFSFKKAYGESIEDWMPHRYLYARNDVFQDTSYTSTLRRAEENGWPLDEVLLLPGQWYKLTLYVRVDRAGAGDGMLRLWVGKVGGEQHLISRRNNLQFSTSDYPNRITGSFGLWGYGGNSDWFASPETQFTFYDNFIMRTGRPADIPAGDM